MGQIFRELPDVSVTTTGSAGSASGSGATAKPVNGALYAVYANYHASAPATTKLVIKDSAGRTLWTGTAENGGIGNTDALIVPRVGPLQTDLIPFAGREITFEVSLSDALTGAVVFTPIVLE